MSIVCGQCQQVKTGTGAVVLCAKCYAGASQLVEDTANMLRGMTLAPAIPPHTKEAMQERIQTLEGLLEKFRHGLAA